MGGAYHQRVGARLLCCALECGHWWQIMDVCRPGHFDDDFVWRPRYIFGHRPTKSAYPSMKLADPMPTKEVFQINLWFTPDIFINPPTRYVFILVDDAPHLRLRHWSGHHTSECMAHWQVWCWWSPDSCLSGTLETVLQRPNPVARDSWF